MSNNLLALLSRAIFQGRQEAERILASLSRGGVRLKTQDWVLPAMDHAVRAWIKANAWNMRSDCSVSMQQNLLVHGDDVSVMEALLAGDEEMAPLRGKVDFIHLHVSRDPVEAGMRPSPSRTPRENSDEAFEAALAAVTLRLILIRQLMSTCGTIYIDADERMGLFVHAVAKEIFRNDRLTAVDGVAGGILLTKARTVALAMRETFLLRVDHVALLGDVLPAFTGPGSIVIGLSGGGGELPAIAEKLKRRWIVSEDCDVACAHIRERLIAQNAEPFLYQVVEQWRPQVEQRRSAYMVGYQPGANIYSDRFQVLSPAGRS